MLMHICELPQVYETAFHIRHMQNICKRVDRASKAVGIVKGFLGSKEISSEILENVWGDVAEKEIGRSLGVYALQKIVSNPFYAASDTALCLSKSTLPQTVWEIAPVRVKVED